MNVTAQPAIGGGAPAPAAAVWVDVHCHLLPGIDDGPETVEQAVALCRLLSREGVAVAVATPHQLGRYEGANAAAAVRAAVADLRRQLDRFRVNLDVRAGGEVRLDERIPRLLADDQVLTLGDTGKYLLLELPSGLAYDSAAVLARVSVPGVRIVLAHAERYDFLRAPGAAERWRDAGVLLQVNGSSLVGGWGPAAQQAGWELLSRGVAAVVASDAHSVGQRRPRWSDATRLIVQHFGAEAGLRWCSQNPRRIVNGEPIE